MVERIIPAGEDADNKLQFPAWGKCMTVHNVLTRLDKSSFLGLDIWDFSLRSLRTRYGHAFLSRIVLRHPLKTLAGYRAYRRLAPARSEGDDITALFEGSEEDFISRMVTSGADLLMAVGFCLKPLAPQCPAGRPNHDCVYLDGLDLRRQREISHSACRRCAIKEIGTKALLAGASMHIMTSALDIAYDVMIPAIERDRFRNTIMCLCPYSVQAIALPLIICGIEGFLISYASGNCLDYEQWLLADEGVKNEMTALSAPAHGRLTILLGAAAREREKEGRHLVRFVRQGNIYVPSES